MIHNRLCARSWLSGNLGKTVLRLIEIMPMYYDTSLKTSRVDWSALSCLFIQSPTLVTSDVYFQEYKKRAKDKGKKKCHTKTMRGRKSRYNLYIREPPHVPLRQNVEE